MANLTSGPIRKAVIDTSPLLAALLLDFVRNRPQAQRDSILRNSRIAEYLRTDQRLQREFIQFFDSISNILITSHVVAELQGLVNKLDGGYKKQFWLGGMSYLSRKRLDERSPLSLIDMHEREDFRKAVCNIGPTDVWLIELARQEGCTLLTDDDRTLARYAWELGVDCRLVQSIIS